MTKFLVPKLQNMRMAKHTAVIALAVLLVVISAVLLSKFGLPKLNLGLHAQSVAVDSSNTVRINKPSVFKEAVKSIYLPPLLIEFKDQALQVEEIGVEEGGVLGVPQSWHTAGWYTEGAKPGEEGNVLIDGHYDTNTGAPGAFWGLKDLQVGDKVLLTDKLGRVFEYAVSTKSFISISDPARSQVFASGKERILTLITCGGVWDPVNGTYNKRLVLTAVFVKMEKSW